MFELDNTQIQLIKYLKKTESTFNKLLLSFHGQAKIRSTLDLGFPHDVIRIAGGFATGAYVEWKSDIPIIPVDTCVNVCSCSIFEIEDDIRSLFCEEKFNILLGKINNSIYISNYHRGNHFISYLQSKVTGKRFLLLHSSASEFKSNYNGLYPVRDNWYYDDIKVYRFDNSYIRYIEGKKAELFYKIAQNAIEFNEIRQEFIAESLIGNMTKIKNVNHFHHYFMPNNHSVIMGSHIITSDQITPVLTIPGADIYMVKFISPKSEELYIDKKRFLTPHGWGKRHKYTPKLDLNVNANQFSLDEINYNIEFGESIRAHPNLELRDFKTKNISRKENFFSYLSKFYNFNIIDEFTQIASYNKAGVIKW